MTKAEIDIYCAAHPEHIRRQLAEKDMLRMEQERIDGHIAGLREGKNLAMKYMDDLEKSMATGRLSHG